MNSKKIISLMSLLLITSCSGNANSNSIPSEPENWENVYENNVQDFGLDFEKTKDVTTLDNLSNDVSYDYEYARMGLVVVKEGRTSSFYSLVFGSSIFSEKLDNNLLDYSVAEDENIGFILTIKYAENTYVIDPFGRTLISCTYSDSEKKFIVASYNSGTEFSNASVGISATTEYVDGFVVVRTYQYGSLNSMFYYDSQSSLVKIASLDQMPKKIENDIALGRPGVLTFGQKFKDLGRVELSEYGIPGWTISEINDFYTVFDSNGAMVYSFTLPQSSLIGCFVSGGKMIYQTRRLVEEKQENETKNSKSVDYTFSQGDDKYLLTTYSKDLYTGETKEIKFNYLIDENSISYKDSSGVNNYFLLYLHQISADKQLLPDSIQKVADSNLNFLKDATNEYIDKFIRLDDTHFYNLTNQIIYDSEFKPTLYINDIHPELKMKEKCFIGRINGFYGAIDFDGKVILDFNSREKPIIKNGKAIILKNDGYYRKDMSSGKERYLGYKCIRIYDDLFLFKDREDFFISNIDKELVEQKYIVKNTDIYDDVPYYTLSTKFGAGEYAFIVYKENIYRFSNNQYNGAVKLSVNDTIDTSKRLANSSNDAVHLVKGDNDILVSDEDAYFSFREEAKKLYCLTYATNIEAERDYYDDNYTSGNGYFYHKATVNGNYLFSLRYTNYSSSFKAINQVVNLKSYDEGEHILNPKAVKENVKETFVSSLNSPKYYSFRTPYFSESSRTYRITIDTEYSYSFTGSDFRKIDYKTYELTALPLTSYGFEIYSSQVKDTTISFTLSKYTA